MENTEQIKDLSCCFMLSSPAQLGHQVLKA